MRKLSDKFNESDVTQIVSQTRVFMCTLLHKGTQTHASALIYFP